VSVTYLEAIREAQAKLLADDDRVFIYVRISQESLEDRLRPPKGWRKNFPGAC
jgi:hypothetical protein